MTQPAKSEWGEAILAAKPWVEILAHICVAVGVVIAVVTYLDQRESAQLQRSRDASLQFVAMRNDAVYAEASQTVLSALLLNARLEINRGNDDIAKKGDADAIIKEVGVGKLDSLAMFYASVGWCVQSETCEAGIINPVFRDEIALFYCSTRQFVLPDIAKRFGADNRYRNLEAYFNARIKDCPKGETVTLPL